jgi:hypothetical protein
MPMIPPSLAWAMDQQLLQIPRRAACNPTTLKLAARPLRLGTAHLRRWRGTPP